MLAKGYGGLHIGLPTAATANAMYGRVGRDCQSLFDDPVAVPSFALAHGRAQRVREDVSAVDGSVFCAGWTARSNKRCFLAQVGSATIDQALLAVLPVRHQSLRLWGLLDNVLVVDEAHAYDAYMQREIETLLEFQALLGGSAVILSATLPSVIKSRLVDAWQRGLCERRPSWQPASTDYPLATVVGTAPPVEHPVELRAGLDRTVPVRRIGSTVVAYAEALVAARWAPPCASSAIGGGEHRDVRGVARRGRGRRHPVPREILRWRSCPP